MITSTSPSVSTSAFSTSAPTVPCSPSNIYNPEVILELYREKWMVFNRDGHPKRPPNGYILCRSCAGKEAANEWGSLPPSVRLFWENTAEMLAKEHRLLFPDYTFQPVRGRIKKARGRPYRTEPSKARSRRRGPYDPGDGTSASSLAIVYEGSHDNVVSGPITTLAPSSEPELSSTFGSPSAPFKNPCGVKSRETGLPKALNGFIFFKSFSCYGAQKASRIWSSMTFEEKRWWYQVARLEKEDLQRVTFAIDDLRDSESGIPEPRSLNTQPHPEQDWIPSPSPSMWAPAYLSTLFQAEEGHGHLEPVVPPYTELQPACVPLCTNHAFDDLFTGYQWELQQTTSTFQDNSYNHPDTLDWSTLVHSWRPWNEFSTGFSPGQPSPLDLELGLPAVPLMDTSMADTNRAESIDATLDFLRLMLGLSSVPESF